MLRTSLRIGCSSITFPVIRQNAAVITTASRYQSIGAAATQTKNNEESFEVSWAKAKPYSTIPGPSRFQLIRCFMPGGDLYKRPLADVQKYMRKHYGEMVKLPSMFGTRAMLMTFDPNIFEVIYRTEGNWPLRRGLDAFEYFRKQVRPELFGDSAGLVFEQGEKWGNMRKSVGPVMLKLKGVKSYVPVVDQVTREFVAKMGRMRDAKGEMPADFGNEMGLWAIESIGVIALDRRFGVLEQNRNKEADTIIKAVRDFFVLSYLFESEPTVWRYYKTKKFLELMDTLDTLTNLVLKYINEKIAEMDKLEKDGIKKSGSTEESVLQKLLQVDRKYAILMVFDMIIAGIDTTASSSQIFLYHLAQNQDKQAKLTEEIFKMVPNIDSPLTEETLNNMPYFKACLKESMRLQPLVPGHVRGAGQDLVLNGYQVPKNSDIFMSMICTEEAHFTEGMKYIPERWLRGQEEAVAPASNPSPYAFLPFGFGTRMCVGRRFAELEMEVLLTRILREYRVEWHHGPIEYSLSILNTPSSPLRFRLIKHDAK